MKDDVKRVLTSELPIDKQSENGFSADYLQDCLEVLGMSLKELSRGDIEFVANYVRTGLKLSIGTPEYFSSIPDYTDELAYDTSKALDKIRTRVKRAIHPDL